MTSAVVFFQIAVIAVMGLIFHLLPRLARREIYFAVTVAGSFPDSERARRILAAYR